MYGNEQYVRHRGRFIVPVLQSNPNGLICRNDANCNANGINTQYNFGVFVDTGVINWTPTAANGLPITLLRIAKMLLTNCHNIPNKLQQHNIQKTKTILLQCKNLLLAMQKGGFCTPKTILLLTICKLIHYQRVTRYYPFG